MKYRDAIVAWTPTDLNTPTSGQIEVGPWPDDTNWTGKYSCTDGACWVYVRALNCDDATLAVFLAFHSIVVRDGIHPHDAHREFLKIDEYRERIAEDIEGAENPTVF